MLGWIYTCQNATVLEISCQGSIIIFLFNHSLTWALKREKPSSRFASMNDSLQPADLP